MLSAYLAGSQSNNDGNCNGNENENVKRAIDLD